MITHLLNRFMDIYLENAKTRVDANDESHKLICGEIVDILKDNDKLNHYYIKGSDGIGQKTFYPWICLMDSNITRSPQKGIYIAILFKRNMDGFYIALNQGITFFKESYKSAAYKKAEEAASYFRKEINDKKLLSKISLGGSRPDNGFGFEKTTVISQYFAKNTFSEKEFFDCLENISNIYEDIIATMDGCSYERIIPTILDDAESQFELAEKAIENIQSALYQGEKPGNMNLIEVERQKDRITRYRKITKPSNRKIDYLKKAQENAQIGLLGEKLILAFEIDRLNRLGLEEFSKKIEHCSLINDVLGYDIKSFDIDSSGTIHEIYIEVKTTSSAKDIDFYASKNEVEQSKKLKNHYWIYRVYNCTMSTCNPKFYRVCGSLDDNYILNPETYKATIKDNAKVISSNNNLIEKIKITLDANR